MFMKMQTGVIAVDDVVAAPVDGGLMGETDEQSAPCPTRILVIRSQDRGNLGGGLPSMKMCIQEIL
jgi:hypothetical protein